MKKISLLIALLTFLGFGYSAAQQMQVTDLAGDYVCTTAGLPASLTFAITKSDVELIFCPDIANDCNSYKELFPTLVDGKIMQKNPEDTDSPINWTDIRLLVEENEGTITITASYADGIDYVFERK